MAHVRRGIDNWSIGSCDHTITKLSTIKRCREYGFYWNGILSRMLVDLAAMFLAEILTTTRRTIRSK